jgi:hypothetical protein
MIDGIRLPGGVAVARHDRFGHFSSFTELNASRWYKPYSMCRLATDPVMSTARSDAG